MINQFNASRRVGGGITNNIDQELENVRRQGQFPILRRAVVIEIFNDPILISNDKRNEYIDILSNSEYVGVIPKNAIIGQMISGGDGLGTQTFKIFFPLFPPHIAMPLKPGEQVFVIFEDPFLDSDFGFYTGRIPEGIGVDDINYTHGERRYDPLMDPTNVSPAKVRRLEKQDTTPSFRNGSGTPDSFTINAEDIRVPTDVFDDIVKNSEANKNITYEPVPRFTKRPGDLALQGSNNTLIVMGEDRTGSAQRKEEGSSNDKKNKAGTIDIVVGRGRVQPENENIEPGTSQTSPTAPRVIENTRQNKETLKTPWLFSKQENSSEGDPDFTRDMSRIYMSMKTAGDKNFNINQQKINVDGLITDIDDQFQDEGAPYLIGKSDHIRLIARNNLEGDASSTTTKGDIRIIKEGQKSDDLAMIVLNSRGEQIIVGKNIQIKTTNPQGKVYIATDGTNTNEPYLLYSKTKQLVEILEAQILNLKDALLQIVSNVSMAAPTSVCPPGGPDPAWATLVTLLQSNPLLQVSNPGSLINLIQTGQSETLTSTTPPTITTLLDKQNPGSITSKQIFGK